MPLTLQSKQYLLYATLLALTAILAALFYPKFNPQWVYYRKAETFFFSKDFSSSIPLYKQAIKTGLKLPNAFIHLSDAYLETENQEEAFRLFEGLNRSSPDNADIIKRLAALYDRFGRVDEAIALYRNNKNVLSSDIGSLIHLADIYKRIKEFKKAEELYREVLLQHPDSIPARLRLAEMLAWIGRDDEAIVLYQTFLKNYPDNRLVRIHLARALSWNGRFEEAIKEYKKILGESK